MGRGGAERLTLDITRELHSRQDIEVKLVSFGKSVDYEYDTSGLDYVYCPTIPEISVLNPNKPVFSTAFADLVNDFKPDIIHSHLYKTEIITRGISYPKAKWFSHCHDNMKPFQNFGLNNFSSKRNFTNFLEKRFLFHRYKLNGGNRFLAISKDTQAYFERTAPDFPTTLFPNAIDFQKFFIDRNSCETGTKLILVNTGNFAEKKNQIFFIKLAEVLRTRNIDFEIHLLGDGGLRESVTEAVRKNGLEQNIILHGNVSNVAEFLQNASIYLHSATYEPLGLVLIEAMASGLPVVTLDGKGNRDLIIQGKNGFMLFEHDAEKFADAVLVIWNDKTKYKEMSAFAQEFARQYDIKAYIDRLLVLYQNALML